MTTLLVSVCLFVFLTCAIAGAGYVWLVRPAAGLRQLVNEPARVRTLPSFSSLLESLGALVPVSPRDVALTRARLVAAGYPSRQAVTTLYGVKLVVTVGLFIFDFTLGHRAEFMGPGVVPRRRRPPNPHQPRQLDRELPEFRRDAIGDGHAVRIPRAASLSAACYELIRFHNESIPFVVGQPGHDEWERCGCEVAVTVREMMVVEQKLYAEMEGRGVFP